MVIWSTDICRVGKALHRTGDDRGSLKQLMQSSKVLAPFKSFLVRMNSSLNTTTHIDQKVILVFETAANTFFPRATRLFPYFTMSHSVL